MRRQWHVGEAFWQFLIGGWLFGGMVAFIVVGSTTENSHSHGLTTPGWIALAAWISPVPLAILAAIVFLGLPAAWHARPRRVLEPIAEDLREAHRRSQ